MFLVRAYHMITLSLSSQQLNRTADTQKLNPRILKGNRRIEQLYRTRQHFVCSEKTDTTTPGKLGRAVGFSTRASRLDDGFRLYCNCTVGFYKSLLMQFRVRQYPHTFKLSICVYHCYTTVYFISNASASSTNPLSLSILLSLIL